MRSSVIILYATFLIGLFTAKCLYSQTLLIPEIGTSLHNIEVEESSGSIILFYEGLKNNFDVDVGLDLKHYFLPKWFISINSNIYLKSHIFSIHTGGFIPRMDYSYRLFSYGLKSGFEIINNFEVGLGVARIQLYDRKESNIVTVKQVAGLGSRYCSTFFMSYKWNKFITSITYNKATYDSYLTSVDLFSISFGYRWKIFEPTKRNSKVNCPKL